LKLLLWTSAPLPGTRGDSIHIWELAHLLGEEGHEVHVVGELTAPAEAYAGVPARFHRLRHLRGHWELRRLIRQRGLELVYGFVHCFSDGGLLAARLAGVPFVAEIADDPISVYFNARPEWQRYWGSGMERGADRWLRLLLRQADGVVTLCSHLDRYYAAKYHTAGLQTMLPQGGDLERFHPGDGREMRAALGFTPEQVVVCFAGSQSHLHGLHCLVGALPPLFARRPQARALLLLSGGDRDQERLREDMARAGVDARRVKVCRHVPFADMPRHYAAADICIAAHVNDGSRPLGSSPKKLTEYSGCARAIVCSDLPELQEAAGDAAEYFPAGDAAALAEVLVRLIDDPARRAALGAAARARAEERMDRRKRAARMVAFCRQVIESRALRIRPGDLAAWGAIQLLRVARGR